MDRYKITKKASVLGIVGNIFLLIIKGIVSIISNSQALLADTFNSAGDVFSSLMTYIGNRISSKEADEDHNLGHGKAEYIFSLLISITMIIMALSVIKSSVTNLVNKEYMTYSIWLVIVCITTIIIKFLLFIYTHKISKKYKNILIEANSKDHRNDCMITLLTLVSVICSLNKIYFIDCIIGVLISFWILIIAFKIFKESYDVLMDKSMDEETKEKVYSLIKKHSEVKKINHFNATPVGFKYQISFTIFVDGNLSTFESHEIANRIEREIEKEIDEVFLTVIHVNPM